MPATPTNGTSQSLHPRYLLLGEILRPHGVRGELRMRVLTDYPERIVELDTVYIGENAEDEDPAAYQAEGMRMHKGYGLLKLKGIDDRTQAERLRQLFVMVSLEQAVPLEEDEIYLFQLIGLEVYTEAGDWIGSINEVLETGANDVYILHHPDHGEILIPITEETHIKTDLEAGTVVVRLPEGLLPAT